MRYKFLVIGVAFSVLFSCFISVKAQAQTLSFTPTNSSCNLQSLSSCDRNDLIMLLIQLILQTMNQPVVETPSAVVLQPVVDSQLYEGTQITIKWQGAKDTKHLIELLSEDGTGWHLSYDAKTDSDGLGQFIWNVNSLDGKYGKYKINIESQDTTNKYSATSGYFTINKKNLYPEVLYPTAGIFISSNIDIKWQGAKDTRHIIEVVSENGTGWHLSYDAKTDSNGFGKFIWDINSLGTEYGKFKIRIESQDATNKYSIDSGYFTIEEDVIEKILYPTANENFYEGKQVTIKWQGAKDTEHLIELLSEDGTGGHLSYHAKTDSNGLGELVWNVNPLNGKYGKYRISIQSQDATNKYSIASEYFTINGDDLKKYEKFGAKELVEDNLPNDITFWTEAYCPNSNSGFDYTTPAGYEVVSCEKGGIGTHGGCSYCVMSKIKLKVKTNDLSQYSKFGAKELVEDNLPNDITFWTEAYCPNSNSGFDYTTPAGYEVVSCEKGGIGTHGGCSYCVMSKIKLKTSTNDASDLKKYEKFGAKELVEDNLPNDITFWTEAYCPNSNSGFDYTTPAGYEVVSCEKGGIGTHGGCSYCVMSKIKLKENINSLSD